MNTEPQVAGMLSSVVSSETLNLAYRLLFLFAAALGFWRLNRRSQAFEKSIENSLREFATFEEAVEKRLQKMEGVKEPYVSLQSGEIIHPSLDGVLWKWDAEIGAAGPFCPRHRDRLFHNNWLKQVKADDFDDGFLNETWWLTCPVDREDFKIHESHVTRVRELRAQAAARLRGR